MFTLEPAKKEETDKCYEILDMGREFQRKQGFIQWDQTYPTYDMVTEDIKNGNGYVLKTEKGEIAAYMYLSFDGDKYYDAKKEIWDSDEPYAVMHRMSVHDSFRGKGITSEAFRLIEELCIKRGIRYIRGDTKKPNERMQHVFLKNGFTYRGDIFYVDIMCMAFDKKF